WAQVWPWWPSWLWWPWRRACWPWRWPSIEASLPVSSRQRRRDEIPRAPAFLVLVLDRLHFHECELYPDCRPVGARARGFDPGAQARPRRAAVPLVAEARQTSGCAYFEKRDSLTQL